MKERRKYHIILLENINSGEVRKINFKFPDDIKSCSGFMFSANVPGQEAKNYVLGNLSLFFNNRKSHPLHYVIQEKPLNQIKKKYKTLPFGEYVETNSFIQGFYQDLGTAASFPYTVRIYFECTQLKNETEK